MIEGIFNKGDDLIIIDDIITSGESVIESLEHLGNFNIKKIIVILDRKEGGLSKLKKLGYNIESIFDIDQFVKNSHQLTDIKDIKINPYPKLEIIL